MATITRYPFVRHLRTAPTSHVVQLRDGTVRRSGTGLSFWFRPLTAVLSEVPVDDRELPLVARARTADLQEVTAQVTVSYRFEDPELVVGHVQDVAASGPARHEAGVDPAVQPGRPPSRDGGRGQGGPASQQVLEQGRVLEGPVDEEGVHGGHETRCRPRRGADLLVPGARH